MIHTGICVFTTNQECKCMNKCVRVFLKAVARGQLDTLELQNNTNVTKSISHDRRINAETSMNNTKVQYICNNQLYKYEQIHNQQKNRPPINSRTQEYINANTTKHIHSKNTKPE